MANPLFDALIGGKAGSQAPFLTFPDGSSLSYGQAVTLSLRMAGALASAGVKPGDRVALQAEKSPEALMVYLGCLAAGAIILPLNPAYTAAEAAYFISDAEPRLVICDPTRLDGLSPVAASVGAQVMTLDASGRGTFMEAVSAALPLTAPAAREHNDLAAILYTSGTTGRSKGAMISHGNLIANATTLTHIWKFTAEDVLLHALPIFHTHGLFVASNVSLMAGAGMLYLPRFDAAEVLGLLPRASVLMGVPTFYTRLLAQPGLNRAAAAHMRLFISGSAPLLAETHREFSLRTGHAILERYGMTETNMLTSNPYEGERRPGSAGLALPDVELRIRDSAGQDLPAGEVGSIEVRGPNVFAGYWRMPEKTKADFRADGFFITGDVGSLDGAGYLTISGRAKDLIITGGLNVYPSEVESVLDSLPGVAESAVFGVPHPDFGEAVAAVVVARRGAELDEAALLVRLATQLARFKQPKRIITVTELPRNSMGKVQKAALRQHFSGLFSVK